MRSWKNVNRIFLNSPNAVEAAYYKFFSMSESNIKVWILAARPKTLPAAAAPVIIGTAMAYEAGGFHLYSALIALLGALLIQIGTNLANDYFDFKKGTDLPDRLGPIRVTQSGLIPVETVKRGMIIIFTLALLSGIYLVYRGGWPIVIIGLLSILFGVLYTGGPKPIGYIGLGDIFVLIFFGPVAVGGTFYVQTLSINQNVLIAGLAPGLFSMAILTVNNLRDIVNDKKTGKKTLAVRFGKTFARIEYLLTIVLAAIIPLSLYLFTGRHIYSVTAGVVFLFALPSIKKVFTTEGIILNKVLAATGVLLLIYSLIFSIGWLL